MPGGDRTGPMGMGPMTGRAAGRCAGYGAPGSMNAVGEMEWDSAAADAAAMGAGHG